jgi:hypothetical protein
MDPMYSSEYPEAPIHPHIYAPPNVLRLESGVYRPTTSSLSGSNPPYPMPSFLVKKYEASRSASGTGTPGSSYNSLGAPTPNNSFNSRTSTEAVADVEVVPNPEASVSMPTYEEPVAHHQPYHRPYHRPGYDDDAFGEHPQPQQPQQQQYHSHHSRPHNHFDGRRPAYQPRRQQPAQQQSWYRAPAPTAPISQAEAISEWQQQLQIKQQRAPRTADFGFGAKPEEERHRALAENRQLAPVELKRLRKFYDNRNEHSHPTSKQLT